MQLVPSRPTRRVTPLKVMLLLAVFFAPEFAAAGNPRDPELTLPASHWEMVAGAGASAGGWWLMAGKDERENKRRRLNQTLNGDMRNMFPPVGPSSAGRRIATGAAAVAAVGAASSRGDTAPTAAASAASAAAAAASSAPATAASAPASAAAAASRTPATASAAASPAAAAASTGNPHAAATAAGPRPSPSHRTERRMDRGAGPFSWDEFLEWCGDVHDDAAAWDAGASAENPSPAAGATALSAARSRPLSGAAVTGARTKGASRPAGAEVKRVTPTEGLASQRKQLEKHAAGLPAWLRVTEHGLICDICRATQGLITGPNLKTDAHTAWINGACPALGPHCPRYKNCHKTAAADCDCNVSNDVSLA